MIASILILSVFFISIVAIIVVTIWYKKEKDKLTEERYEILKEIYDLEDK